MCILLATWRPVTPCGLGTFITQSWRSARVNSRVDETNVIDNKKVVLKTELIKILPATKNVSIAVGYFFISGLSMIIEPLSKVDSVRLLISNTTDKPTSEALLEAFNSARTIIPKLDATNFVSPDYAQQIIGDVELNVKHSLERMEQTPNDQNVVQNLIKMMSSRQLEVRVYPKEKLHAKAYIFESRTPDFTAGMGIVGSSNLSMAGISENSELNLKTTNPSDVNKLLDWFNDLWGEGLEFTDKFNLILSRSWAVQPYSPRDLFLKAIYHESKSRFDHDNVLNPLWLSHGPKLYPFQLQAVNQCITMIERYGGVILGDVVGLGKTYVGTAILKYLQQEYRPLIVCPPALVSMWEKFCDDYEVDALVLSRGKLTKHHNELSRYKYKSRNMVLIDESHRFKNSKPIQYQHLHQFMQERAAKAILLTATPYSNKPEDIKNQLMLFHTSENTRIPPANETNLNTYFHLIKNGQADLTDLLRNIMIRRTRRYVLEQWGHEDEYDATRKYLLIEGKRQYFPKRIMKTLRYDINKAYHDRYESIVSKLDHTHLTLARYGPGLYLKDSYKHQEPYVDLHTHGIELVRLIRSLLLKRMESSIHAFSISIKRYINTHKIFLAALKDNVVPVGDFSVREMYEAADQELDLIDDPTILKTIINKIREQKEIKYHPDAFHINDFIMAIEHDLQTFNDIMDLITSITFDTDDKLHQLQELLNNYMDKKVIIFTEFAATAEYLHDHIVWTSPDYVELVTSNKHNAVAAARRFDPKHNPSGSSPPDHLITLLITTDVLSEGVNLQAGHVVINYDFHWNPVRLIQRVGRVDRIGSENDHIAVHNFLPDPTIEKDLKLEVSVDSKITEIQRVIGEDYMVLKEDEKINEHDLYAIYNGDANILDREDDDSLLPAKFDQLLIDIHENNPKLWDNIRTTPYGIRGSSHNSARGRLLLACENGTTESGIITKYYLISSKKQIQNIDQRKALCLLESSDRHIRPLPGDYNQLVSLGFTKFLSDVQQIQTSDHSSTTPNKPQQKIMQRLMNITKHPGSIQNYAMVEPLIDAFSTPIPKGRIRNALSRIDFDTNDFELVDALVDIYHTFDLKMTSARHDPDYGVPRILYSEYVDDLHE